MAAERSVTFYVRGAPIPQGSVEAHVGRRKDGSRYASVHYRVGTKLHAWRRTISVAARAEWGGEMTYHPVRLELTFYMKRPLSHYQGLEMTLRPAYQKVAHDTVPDLDKLVRAVMDALTECVYSDDSQVIDVTASKRYVPNATHPPGVEVTINALP